MPARATSQSREGGRGRGDPGGLILTPSVHILSSRTPAAEALDTVDFLRVFFVLVAVEVVLGAVVESPLVFVLFLFLLGLGLGEEEEASFSASGTESSWDLLAFLDFFFLSGVEGGRGGNWSVTVRTAASL